MTGWIMGGYGLYIMAGWGITLAFVAGLWIMTERSLATARQQLADHKPDQD